jgi:hypothetical protein
VPLVVMVFAADTPQSRSREHYVLELLGESFTMPKSS